MRSFRHTWVIVMLPLISCIDKIDDFETSNGRLVIDGLFTNQYYHTFTNEVVEHKVRVYYTTPYNQGTIVEDSAFVFIENQNGEVEEFDYGGFGFYYLDSTAGVIGESYRLNVVMPDDRIYQSPWETMVAAPPIDEVTKQNVSADKDFFISFDDPDSVRNFYRWRYYRYFLEDSVPNYRRDPEFLMIASDELFDGERVNDHFITRVPYNQSGPFDYFFIVEQYSLTRSAYTYWLSITSQLENGGTIFETNNFEVLGNMTNLQDPSDRTLGVFQLSPVTDRSLEIHFYD